MAPICISNCFAVALCKCYTFAQAKLLKQCFAFLSTLPCAKAPVAPKVRRDCACITAVMHANKQAPVAPKVRLVASHRWNDAMQARALQCAYTSTSC